eukprot:gene11401-12104_t
MATEVVEQEKRGGRMRHAADQGDGAGLRTLRKMHPLACIPVIMVSAKSKEEHIVEGLGAGCNDYVVKPLGA